jgi:hypothetical protein
MVLDSQDSKRRATGWRMTARLLEDYSGAGFAVMARGDVRQVLREDAASSDPGLMHAAAGLRQTFKRKCLSLLGDSPG